MTKQEVIEFLGSKIDEIDQMNASKENVQLIIDFGLDVKNMLKALELSPGSDFMQSLDLFNSLLDEKFKGDDDKFFNESKDDLVMDITLLMSRLQERAD